jgi:hypothetical protein
MPLVRAVDSGLREALQRAAGASGDRRYVIFEVLAYFEHEGARAAIEATLSNERCQSSAQVARSLKGVSKSVELAGRRFRGR